MLFFRIIIFLVYILGFKLSIPFIAFLGIAASRTTNRDLLFARASLCAVLSV